jgi:hypothetical protein
LRCSVLLLVDKEDSLGKVVREQYQLEDVDSAGRDVVRVIVVAFEGTTLRCVPL